MSTSPSAGPASLLFGVLESHARGPGAGAPGGPHDTVAIAGLDGVARARASYAARPSVYVGNAAAVYPPVDAYVTAGRVWFADGLGVVRTLAPDGKVAVAARFGLNGDQQELSFAVSPDGSRTLAVRLDLPAKGPPAAGAPFPTLVGHWRQEVLEAAGGVVRSLHRWQAAATSFPNTPGSFPVVQLMGWDRVGPVALVGNAVGTQNAFMDNQRVFGGHLAHLDASGQPQDVVTKGDCLPVALSAAGLVTCVNTGGSVSRFKVVSTAGQTVWDWTPAIQPEQVVPGDLSLSPDGGSMAMLGGVVRRDGSVRRLPGKFHPEGWLDQATIYGRLDGPNGSSAGDAALVRLDDPGRVRDLGFSGDLAGVLAT